MIARQHRRRRSVKRAVIDGDIMKSIGENRNGAWHLGIAAAPAAAWRQPAAAAASASGISYGLGSIGIEA